MAVFSVTKGTARKILPIKAGLEKDIQRLFERNLLSLLDITFLHTEYSTSFGGRIDTLGIDKTGAPVIIEYKRTQDQNVMNQGLAYLYWLLDHKADFEKLTQNAKLSTKIDWASSRVICIAESYNKVDLDAAAFLPIKIELYRYCLYENDLLTLELEVQRKITVPTSQIVDKKERSGDRPFREQTVEERINGCSEHTRELFFALKERIVALDDAIIEEPKAKYISYKLTTNVADVVVLKNSITIILNLPSGKLKNPSHIFARDLTKPKVGHWGTGDYEVKFEQKAQLDDLMALVRQSYEQ